MGLEIGGPDISIERLGVRANWTNLGEGNVGDYDSSDPEDVNLLRFELSVLDADGQWVEVDDSSYCTQVPADTDDAELRRLLELILDETVDQVLSQGKAKRTCEHLSWMTPGFGLSASTPTP